MENKPLSQAMTWQRVFGKLPEPKITAYWRQTVSWTHNKWLEQTQILPMQRVQVMIFLSSPDIWKLFLFLVYSYGTQSGAAIAGSII